MNTSVGCAASTTKLAAMARHRASLRCMREGSALRKVHRAMKAMVQPPISCRHSARTPCAYL